VLGLASGRGVAAPPPPDPAVRASFLFSFARFTDWPADVLAAASPIRLCVGDRVLASALETVVAGRLVQQHGLTVQQITPDSAMRSCHVLDLSGLDIEQSRRILESLRGASVLTIGDTPRFTEAGGIASARVEDGTVHLTINVMAAGRARLRIRAQLLNLAAIVGDSGRADAHARRH
jgi:hypothetical protein